ncbi:MAG: FMN-binding protein [Oliverpabstia sp.]
MKTFIIKSVSVLLVTGALGSYNMVLENRSKTEEIARLTAELESSRNALEKVDNSENNLVSGEGYADGMFTGEADGFGGTIQVQVSIQEGQIKDIQIISADGEDGAYLGMAKDIIPAIIENQSADVDTVSGATFSSTGIKNAVSQAIEKAGN